MSNTPSQSQPVDRFQLILKEAEKINARLKTETDQIKIKQLTYTLGLLNHCLAVVEAAKCHVAAAQQHYSQNQAITRLRNENSTLKETLRAYGINPVTLLEDYRYQQTNAA